MPKLVRNFHPLLLPMELGREKPNQSQTKKSNKTCYTSLGFYFLFQRLSICGYQKKTNNVRQAGEDASVHPVSRPENSGRERRADCSNALHPGRQTPQTKFYRLNQRKEESGWQIMGIAIYPGRCGPSWGL